MPRRVLSVIVLASLLALACSGTALAAPTWLEPKNLSEKGFGAFSPRVGFDGSGQAVTSWFGATDTTGDTTQISERPRAGEWSAVKNLQVDGTNTPDLAVSANGTAVVAWEFDDVPESPDGSYIEASVRTNGVWSSAAPLPKDNPLQFAYYPRVAVDSAGDAVVVWQECYSPADKTLCFHNEGEYVVRASVRMAGGEWSTPRDVTTGTTQNAKKLAAAVNPAGDIAVAWEDMKGNRAHVSLKRAGQEAVDHTLSTKTSGSPQVAFAADGTAIAVWDENDAGLWVSGSTAAPGGSTWSAPQHLSSNGYDAFQPDLAVAPGGEAVAVWETLAAIDENSPVAVQGAIRSSGTWLSAQNLSAEVPFKKLPRLPRVAINPAGSAIVAWQVPTGSGNVVEGNVRTAGGGWTGAKLLSAASAGAVEPAVAIDPEGNGLVAWRAVKTDKVDERIQAVGFDAAGPRLDQLAIPSTGTVGQTLGFSVAPSDAWSTFAGSSWNFGDGGGASGTNVTHAFSQPGTYQVTVSASDALGNVTSATGPVTVTSAGVQQPPPGDQPPGPTTEQPPTTQTPNPTQSGKKEPNPDSSGKKEPNPNQSQTTADGVARLSGLASVRDGKAVFALRCSRAGRCSGLAKLVFQHTYVIGKSRFNISAGGSQTLRIALGPAALRLLEGARDQQLEMRLEGRGVKAQKVVLGL